MNDDNACLAVGELQHKRLASCEEHGQTWVTCLDCGRQWGINGSFAEVVTDGDGYCDDEAE